MRHTINFRKALLSVVLMAAALTSHAQWYKWHAGIGVGSLTYYGDLSDRFVNMNSQQFGYHAFAERLIAKSVYLRLESVNGQIKGSDRAKGGWVNRGMDENPNYGRSLNFKTEIHDLNASFVFYLIKMKGREKTPFLNPYFSAGAGVGFFKVFGDLISNETGERYQYWNDLTIRSLAQNDPNAFQAVAVSRDNDYETDLRALEIEKSYCKFKWQIPVAIGVKMRFSDRVGLGLEAKYTYAMTDYIDNVGNLPARNDLIEPLAVYAADPAGFILQEEPRDVNKGMNIKDAYLYLNAGLTINMGTTAKPPFKAPIFYPGELKITPVDTAENYYDNEEEELYGYEDTLSMVIIPDSSSVKSLDSLVLLYNSLLTGTTVVDTIAVQDSLLRLDIDAYSDIWPLSKSIKSNVKVDSMALIPVEGEKNKLLVQYYISFTDSSSYVKTDDSLTMFKTSKLQTFVYRSDSLELENDTLITTAKVVSMKDTTERKAINAVIAKAKPVSSSYFVPENDSISNVDSTSATKKSLREKRTDTLSSVTSKDTIRSKAILSNKDSIKLANSKMIADSVKTRGNAKTYSSNENMDTVSVKKDSVKTTAKSIVDTIKSKVNTKVSDIKENRDSVRVRRDSVQNNPPKIGVDSTKVKSDMKVSAPKADTTSMRVKKIPATNASPIITTEADKVKASSKTTDVKTDTALQRKLATLELQIAQLKQVQPAPVQVNISTSNNVADSIARANAKTQADPADGLDRKEYKRQMNLVQANQNPPAAQISYQKPQPERGIVVAPVIAPTIKPRETANQNNPSQDTLTNTQKSLSSNTMRKTIQDSLAMNAFKDDSLMKAEFIELKKGQDSMILMMKNLFSKMTPPPVAAPTVDNASNVLLLQAPVKVFFAVNQSSVIGQYKASLDIIAQQLKKYSELKIELKGFADPTGNAAANLKLSEKRAAAVRNYFLQVHSIAAERIKLQSIGAETESTDMNFSRRVEVKIVK